MFRALTVKFSISKKALKRIAVFSAVCGLAFLLCTAISIYFYNNNATVITAGNKLTFTLPNAISWLESTAISVSAAGNQITQSMQKFRQTFDMQEKLFAGNEIIYHLELSEKGAHEIHGFIQIWQIQGTVSGFLKRARASMSASVYGFSEQEIKVGNCAGYRWDYRIKGEDRDTYAKQAFLGMPSNSGESQHGQMYVLSLYAPAEIAQNRFEAIFTEILDTFIVKP